MPIGGVVALDLVDDPPHVRPVVGVSEGRCARPSRPRSRLGRARAARCSPSAGRDERIADPLAGPGAGHGRGEHADGEGGLLDPDRRLDGRLRRDRVGQGPAVRRDRADQVRPRNDRCRGGEAQRFAGRAPPRHEPAVGQHRAVVERGEGERLPAAVGVAGHSDAVGVGAPVVDQAADQLLRVADLVAVVGEVDVAAQRTPRDSRAATPVCRTSPRARARCRSARHSPAAPRRMRCRCTPWRRGRGTRASSCRTRGSGRPGAGRVRLPPGASRSCRAARRPRSRTRPEHW